MGTIEGLTKARMLEIEGNSVVSGAIDDTTGHLILTQHDGDHIDAGKARPDTFLDASETNKGVARLATNAEVLAGTDDVKIVTPESLRSTKASDAEVLTGTDTQKYVTPAGIRSTRATLAEVATGTDAQKYVTPAGVKQERDKIVMGLDTYTGVIDSAWSAGKPNVTLDSGQAYTGIVSAFLPGNIDDSIIAGALVLLTRTTAGAWAILSSYATRPRFMRQIPIKLEPASGWCLYSDPVTSDNNHTYGEGPASFGGPVATTLSGAYAGTIYATCTSTGIVQMQGLLTRAGTPVINEVIARIPAALAPARTQFFTNYAGGFGQVAVCADGTIRYIAGGVSYYPLNEMRWRTAASVTAGIATFTALTLNSGYQAHSGIMWTGETGSLVHTPGYTVDADKVYIFEGVVQAVGAKTAPSDVATVTALTAALGTHQACSMSGAFQFVRISAAGGASVTPGKVLNIGLNMANGQFMSIAQVIHVDSSSPTITRITPAATNSWTSYSVGAFAPPAVCKTPDGLVIFFGLWSAGTIGLAMSYIPDGWRSRFSVLMTTVSNALIARVDFNNPATANYGAQPIMPNTGANNWFSLDGCSYPAYR